MLSYHIIKAGFKPY